MSILLGFNSIVFTVLALRISKSIRHNIPKVSPTKLAFESDMPSVTVCIPARNEEHALAECLQRVINSTYEKIEIIVLDDSSNDNTSLLIKSFAHAGVRFVRGSRPPEGWLGKNHALKELAAQASGSYVLFMDVDTRLSPMAIENIMRSTLSRGVTMLSVIPRRVDGWRASVLWSPLKYFWELLRNRPLAPAAASNAWMVKRSVVQAFYKNDEANIKSAVLPEAYIASQLKEEYGFIVGTRAFGVSYEKKWSSQCETSIRLLHPMLGGMTGVSLLASLGLLSLLAPYAILVTALWLPFSLIHSLALGLIAGFGLLYTYYARTLWNTGWQIAVLLWPLIIAQEAILLIISIVLYKQGRVLWKGRPIRSVQPTLK
ncbi:glycosyltransferase [Candidatus Saccharibacteria bacterium TM7i]|nr:glycosyltransferase [Candidatus Saccharibacteria bacterium TM7i]